MLGPALAIRRLGAANSQILGDDDFSFTARGLLYSGLKAIDRFNDRHGLRFEARNH
jgi:hypothetical protein